MVYRKNKITTVLISLAIVLPSSVMAEEKKFVQGVAREVRSRNLVYYENHSEVYKNNRHAYSNVFYKDKNGKVISKKFINFQKSTTAPDFKRNDLQSGGFESSTNLGGNRFRFSYKEDKNSATETKVVSIPGPVVVDGGFDFFVRENWETIMSGRKISVNFAIPSRLDYYNFRLYKSVITTFAGRKAVKINIEINSAVLRLLADSIVVTYDLETRRLLRYYGVSNIASPDGDNYKADIIFNPKYYK